MKNSGFMVPEEIILDRIYLIRNLKVMLDTDLAKLYGVETKVLKQAVRRHRKRFPNDFMIELTTEEHNALKQHFGKLSRGSHSKYPPFAFTEQGVAMLSSVLNSERAIMVNIQIIRIFTHLRDLISTNKDFAARIEMIENSLETYDQRIMMVFEYLKQLEEARQEEVEKGGRVIIKGFKLKESKNK